MRKLRAFLSRVAMLTRRRNDQQFADELDSHLQMHIDDNIRAGMTPDQARREALLKLGGVEATMQAYRDQASLPFVETLVQDLRYTLRQLRKNPGFATTALLVLTLGTAAILSIFAFVDAALIKPLPYQNPSRLIVVYGSIPLGPKFHLSFPDYFDFKKQNKVFSSFEVYDQNGFMLSTPAGAKLAYGARVSAGFFRTLGVTPILGRDFSDADDRPEAPRTVLLTYATWQSRYGGRPDVLGQTVTLDGRPNSIIGVLPRGFHFAPVGSTEFWTTEHDPNNCRGCHFLFGLARLKDGVSLEQAAADMTTIARQLGAQYPSNRDQGVFLMPLTEVVVGDIHPILLALLGGSALLLLIAVVNVASLLLVRTQTRRREVAVRGALGASRRRLLRQFVTEAMFLSGTASATGLLLAYATMHLLLRMIPTDMRMFMPYLEGIGLTPHVLLCALAVALISAVLFSLTPSLSLSMDALRAGLADGGRSASNSHWRRFGSNLVVVELATAVVLLVAAGLFGKSLYHLLQVNPGLRPHNLATLSVTSPDSTYSDDQKRIALEREVLARLSSLPGVTDVALTNKLPVGDGDFTTSFVIPCHSRPEDHNEVAWRIVTNDYFKTLGARILAGRYFTPEEQDPAKPHVAIINHALARQYFQGMDPVGMRINYDGGKPEDMMQIIGVIDDIREGPLDTDARAAFYVPFENRPFGFFSVIARTSVAAQSILPAISGAIHEINPAIATFDGATMDQRIHDSQPSYLHRASTWLVGSFAAVALFLSVVGLYGVIAYSVSQRTREIGVRIALGAQRSTVYQLVMKEAAWVIAFGLIAGLSGSFIAASLIRNLLFATRAWDAATLVTVAAVLGTSALAASYLPAHRAAKVNPTEALRAE